MFVDRFRQLRDANFLVLPSTSDGNAQCRALPPIFQWWRSSAGPRRGTKMIIATWCPLLHAYGRRLSIASQWPGAMTQRARILPETTACTARSCVLHVTAHHPPAHTFLTLHTSSTAWSHRPPLYSAQRSHASSIPHIDTHIPFAGKNAKDPVHPRLDPATHTSIPTISAKTRQSSIFDSCLYS